MRFLVIFETRQAGDVAIKTFARLLKRALRSYGFRALHYEAGGEELSTELRRPPGGKP